MTALRNMPGFQQQNYKVLKWQMKKENKTKQNENTFKRKSDHDNQTQM